MNDSLSLLAKYVLVSEVYEINSYPYLNYLHGSCLYTTLLENIENIDINYWTNNPNWPKIYPTAPAGILLSI